MDIIFIYCMLCVLAAFVGSGIGILSWFLGFAMGLKYHDGEPVAIPNQLLSKLGFWVVMKYRKKEVHAQEWVSSELKKLEKPTPDDARRLESQKPINVWKAFICPICRATHLANFASVFVVVGLVWHGQSLWLGACFWLVCASAALFSSQTISKI